MISHDYRYIFIHQRKCAGMAITSALGASPESPDFHIFNDGTWSDNDLFAHWYQHPEWTENYHIFAVCRNPWDRFVSGWRYLKETQDLGLDEVLDEIEAGNFDGNAKVLSHLVRPQLAILQDGEGRFLPSTMLRFENLQGDFSKLCDQLGIPHRRVPIRNAGKRRPYWTYFDDSTRERVARLFQADIEKFGYSFAPPDQVTRRLNAHFHHLRNQVLTRVRASRLSRFLPGKHR